VSKIRLGSGASIPPNLAKAIAEGDYCPRTIGYAYFIADKWSVDKPIDFWADHLFAHHEAHEAMPESTRYWSGAEPGAEGSPDAGIDRTDPSASPADRIRVTTSSSIRGLVDELKKKGGQ
jgi:hypothetical protein